MWKKSGASENDKRMLCEDDRHDSNEGGAVGQETEGAALKGEK